MEWRVFLNITFIMINKPPPFWRFFFNLAKNQTCAQPALLLNHSNSLKLDCDAYCGDLGLMIQKSLSPYLVALENLRVNPTHKLKEVSDQSQTASPLWWGINTMCGPFVLALFADQDNSKCEDYYSAEDNAFSQDWSARLAELQGATRYAYPPYSCASEHNDACTTGMRHITTHTMAMREPDGRYVS